LPRLSNKALRFGQGQKQTRMGGEMSKNLCPLIVRNVIEVTDAGVVSSTKLHPCIGEDCALWIPEEVHNYGTPQSYRTASHCGLIDQGGEDASD